MQKLYTLVAAANGSVRNSSKASNLPVSKVRQFLHAGLLLQNEIGNTKIQVNEGFC